MEIPRRSKRARETYRVAAVYDRVAASKFSPEKDPFFSDENLYSSPVVFLKDVLAGQRNNTNDDVLGEDEVKEFYEFDLQEMKRKVCGCPMDCEGECCNISKPNKCVDSCGCLCYKDNVLEYTPSRSPGWGDEEDFDLENVGHYLKQLDLSDGFDVQVFYKPRPGRVGGIVRRMKPLSDMTDVDQDYFKKMAVLAIKRYNKMFCSDHRILNVVRVNRRQCGGPTEYFITFVAAGAMGNGKPELFQGKVVHYIGDTPGELTYNREVHLCRPKREVFVGVPSRSSASIFLPLKRKPTLDLKLDKEELHSTTVIIHREKDPKLDKEEMHSTQFPTLIIRGNVFNKESSVGGHSSKKKGPEC